MAKIQSLNTSGIAHYIVPLVIVSLIGVVGTYALVATQAASKQTNTQVDSPKHYDGIKTVNSAKITEELVSRQQKLPDDLRPQKDPEESTNSTRAYYISRHMVVQNSERIARNFWGPVTSRPLCPESQRGNDVKFRAKKMSSTTHGLARLYGNSATKSHDCTIWINDRIYGGRIPSYLADDLCEVIVHEYGHLYGYGHSKNKKDIMYAYASYGGTLKRCNDAKYAA